MATVHNPIRCFDGTALPHEPFWRFQNASETESGQAEMELYGVISEYSWLDDDVTPQKFKADLYSYGRGGPILMKINSPGGDVVAASVMRAIMADYPGEITARVDGLAASAAVIVTLAAKRVQIMDSAYMMIHDPGVMVLAAFLDLETLTKLRDDLRAIKDGIVPTYANRTGLPEDKISRMMADETWMSARQAVAYGFADEILDGIHQNTADQAGNVAYVNCLRNYANLPPAVMRAYEQKTVPVAAVSSDPPPSDDNEREAQTLRDRVTKILKRGDSNA